MDPSNLATAFAVWAGVVGIIGVAIVHELSRLRKEMNDLAARINEVIVDFEHRLTRVEYDLDRRYFKHD